MAWAGVRRLPILPSAILGIVVFCAIFAPLLTPYDTSTPDTGALRQPPFWLQGGTMSHPLGADQLGRDILTRVVFGARISLLVSVIAVFVAGTAGSTIGMVAGYFGGRIDTLLMRLVDGMLALPYMLLALVIVAVLGASLGNVIFVIALVLWASYARIIRGEVLSLKEREYIALARVAGASPWRIIATHIFPNVVNTIIVLATLQMGTVILFEAALSFLGMGVPPPTPTWGGMVAEGRRFLSTAWWLSTFPGLAILVTVLAANLFGDWLRDHLDPLRQQV
ncbi:MAG: ABC transporter permease [Chloroflexi bacterium]|nr:ABC transporter permease [Chloroflexota bacterium]